LHFSGDGQPSLILIVEVKLNSSKSGTGANDQLKRYLDLLDDQTVLPVWSEKKDHRCLVYLTRAFARLEIEESVRLSLESGKEDAAERIFGLQWQDVLETAIVNAGQSELLRELAIFLRVRDFEAFRGFRKFPVPLEPISGRFYGRRYFELAPELCLIQETGGRFYGD
jgi:hypothetical protein